jgi:hypothetical protein
VSARVSKKERLLWILVLSASIVIFVLVISKYQTTLNSVSERVTDLEGAKTTWTQREANLTSEISDLKAQVLKDTEVIRTFPTSDPIIVNELERRGLNGGPNQVIADLLKHNELIPFEGVLGGKMGFLKDKIFVISDKWVIAYFEDGHINGNMLLSYSVTNGNISWKVIDSYLFG